MLVTCSCGRRYDPLVTDHCPELDCDGTLATATRPRRATTMGWSR